MRDRLRSTHETLTAIKQTLEDRRLRIDASRRSIVDYVAVIWVGADYQYWRSVLLHIRSQVQRVLVALMSGFWPWSVNDHSQ